jgi:hypothetical protein
VLRRTAVVPDAVGWAKSTPHPIVYSGLLLGSSHPRSVAPGEAAAAYAKMARSDFSMSSTLHLSIIRNDWDRMDGASQSRFKT